MAGEAGGVQVVCGANAQRVRCPIAQSLAVRFFGLVEVRPSRDGVAHDGFNVFRYDVADGTVRMAVEAEWEDGGFAVGQAFVATEDAEHPADATEIGTFRVGGEPDLLVPMSIFLGAPADRKLTDLDERIVVGHGEERVDVERCFAAGHKGNVIAHECSGEVAVSVLALVVAWLPVRVIWLRPLTFADARVQADGEPVGRGVFEQIGVVVGDEVVQIALMGWFPWLVVAGIGAPAALLLTGQAVTNRELLSVCVVCVPDVGT
jgi:hypothetical protein